MCIGPDCEDGKQNQGETDIDCGGPCKPCAPGDGCVKAGDCEDGVCLNNECKVAGCFDGVHNQDEVDIDCGGICKACTLGLMCGSDADCLTSQCEDGFCTGFVVTGSFYIDDVPLKLNGAPATGDLLPLAYTNLDVTFHFGVVDIFHYSAYVPYKTVFFTQYTTGPVHVEIESASAILDAKFESVLEGASGRLELEVDSTMTAQSARFYMQSPPPGEGYSFDLKLSGVSLLAGEDMYSMFQPVAGTGPIQINRFEGTSWTDMAKGKGPSEWTDGSAP